MGKVYNYRGYPYYYIRSRYGFSAVALGPSDLLIMPWEYGRGAKQKVTERMKSIIDKEVEDIIDPYIIPTK